MALLKHALNLLLFSFGKVNPITGPLRVHWDITELCNSRCRHCTRWKIKDSKTDLSTDECKRVIRELREVNVKAISFAGNEPLMRKDIYELVEYANELGFNTSMNTNGLLLNEKNIERLIKGGLGSFVFSLDSCEDKEHDYLRGVSGSFEKIFKSVELIKKIRLKLNKKSDIQVTTVVSRGNLGKVYNIVKLCKEKGFDKIILQPVHNIKEFFESEEELILREKDISVMQKELDRIIKDFSDFIVTPAEYLRNFSIFVKSPNKLYKYKCAALFITVDLRPNGDVVPCPVGFVKIGNLKKKSFKEIWFSHGANEVRKAIRQDKHPICWFSCIQPINIVARDIGKLRFVSLFDVKFLKHVLSKIKR